MPQWAELHCVIDSVIPDRFGIIGGMISLLGVAVIMYWLRARLKNHRIRVRIQSSFAVEQVSGSWKRR
jgi:hypothetical protein